VKTNVAAKAVEPINDLFTKDEPDTFLVVQDTP
jgi:hypothetical protein